MNILRRLGCSFFRRLKRRSDDDVPRAPVARPGELFEATGWGPAEQFETGKRRPYTGPPFPDRSAKLPLPSRTSIQAINDARHLWSMREFENALKAYEAACASDERNSDILFEEAQLLWSHGDIKVARSKLEEAADADPNNTKVLVSLCRLAALYGSSRNQETAGEILAKCVRIGSVTPTIRALAASNNGYLHQ